MSQWVEKFKAFSAALEGPPFLKEDTGEPEGPLYNIHKRTLPVKIDQPVAFGLSLPEAERMLARLTQEQRYMEMGNRNNFVYFDIVPQDATEAEKSVYYNHPNTRRI